MWPFGESTVDRLQQELDDTGFYGNITAEVTKKKAVFTGEVTSVGQKTLLETIATSINGIDSADASGVTVVERSAAIPEDTVSTAEQNIAKRAEAYQHMQQDGTLKNAPIDVVQRGDRYVVRGAVASEEAKQRALELVKEATGAEVDVDALQVVASANDLNQTDDDGDIVYEVKSGDTLSHIALHYYGSASADAYMKIANANGLADPDKIQVGQKLKIPGTHAGPDAKLA